MREFSTAAPNEAQAVGAAEEARIRTEFLDTGTVIEPVRVIKASVFDMRQLKVAEHGARSTA